MRSPDFGLKCLSIGRVSVPSACSGQEHLRCWYRVAGYPTLAGAAGYAGATANLKLTFHLDHSAGADQLGDRICSIDRLRPNLRVIERPSRPTRPDVHSTNGLSAS